MAQRDTTTFKATKNSRYADNTSGSITAGNSRDMFEDVADSYLNKSDDLLDEDDMASDSATKVPSQQSVKAYVDAQVGSNTSGTWTPTLTAIANVDSLTNGGCVYMQFGDVVYVSGKVSVDATTDNTATSFRFSLPIASAFVNTANAAGTATYAFNDNNSYGAGYIIAVPASDDIAVHFIATDTGSVTIHFTGMYQIL